MTERMSIPVADLIPGDTLVPKGWVVDRYPHGMGTLPGTLVYWERKANLVVGQYYPSPEERVQILR